MVVSLKVNAASNIRSLPPPPAATRRVHAGSSAGTALGLGSIVVIMLVALLVAAVTRADGPDTGTSQNLFIRKQLTDGWFLASRSNFATRDGTGDLFFAYVDITLGRKLAGNWSADVGYRHAWLETASGWRDEFRPLANLTWRRAVDGWSLANRHRLELRMFEGDEAQDRFRYRNESRLVLPERFSVGRLRPFIEEEFFYELDGSGLNVNWLTAGLRYRLRKGLSFKLGYRWQAQKFGNDWSHRHVLVSGLSWRM